MRAAGHSRYEVRKRVPEFLERLNLLHRSSAFPRALSGGEQQRVALARAFVAEPDILFADEPTGNLDQHTGNSIVDLLFALNQDSNTTLILVTHDNSLAERCMRKLVLDEAGLKEVAVKTATAHD